MQILLITQEPPLAPAAVATGNAVRNAQLESTLKRAGYAVRQVWLDKEGSSDPAAFATREELQAILISMHPDIVLVGYWELLELLPFDLAQPVVVDFVAPRPLEVLYEHPESMASQLQRLLGNLSKCDLLLTGNEAQRSLLYYSLLQAGFDLRGSEPVLALPLSAEPVGQPRSDPGSDGWTLVSGGVNWPWRKSEEYWHVIDSMRAEADADAPRLVLFGGNYRWHADAAAAAESSFQTQALMPYASFSRFLLDSAHIGLELASPNIERRFSQSYRSLEFLRHGLPLICNDYLPIARLIREYEAGWTISSADELEALLRDIMRDPGEWRRRSDNALRLVRERLDPDELARPLLNWLELPAKAPRLPHNEPRPAPVVLARPAWHERLRRQAALLRRILLARLIGARPGDNVLIVTRRDLFPADHGAAVKIVETARALSRSGREVGVVSEDRRYWWLFSGGREQRRRLPMWLRLLSLPRALAQLLHLSKELPESNSFLYLPLTDRGFFWHCLFVGGKLKPGILQAEFPAYAKPCIEAREILDAAVVLVEHNVEYERLRAQVPELSETQSRNLKAIEIDLCNRADAVVCVSDNDRQRLLDDGVKPGLLRTIPHGFDPASFASPAREDIRRKFKLPDDAVLIAFHGTFSYPPNRDALQVFADTLLPLLEDAAPAVHVIAIGRNPPTENLHERIHFTGSVDEVGPWLKACDLAVVPLREGGGTRMKIVDCFAAGLPLISTRKGIEGIPVVSGREAIICDDWTEMAAVIRRLAESSAERERLSAAGLAFTAGLDWDSIASSYVKIYAAIRRGGTGGGRSGPKKFPENASG